VKLWIRAGDEKRCEKGEPLDASNGVLYLLWSGYWEHGVLRGACWLKGMIQLSVDRQFPNAQANEQTVLKEHEHNKE